MPKKFELNIIVDDAELRKQIILFNKRLKRKSKKTTINEVIIRLSREVNKENSVLSALKSNLSEISIPESGELTDVVGSTPKKGEFIVKLDNHTLMIKNGKLFGDIDSNSKDKVLRVLKVSDKSFKSERDALFFAQSQLSLASQVYITSVLKSQIKRNEIPIAPEFTDTAIIKDAAIIGLASSIINPTRKKDKFRRNDFISGVQFAAILKKKMTSEMPSGPIGGKPRSTTMLTNRSFTFMNSIKTFINFRTKMIEYWYNPLYKVHDSTLRSPTKQIERNIREITIALYGRKFGIRSLN